MKPLTLSDFGRHYVFLFILMLVSTISANGQEKNDSILESMKPKLLGKLRYFTFGLYIDSYNNTTFAPQDTSNIVPFAANCPVQNQLRLNVAALEFYYNSEKVRGKLVLQYGDAPNLLASPNAQFIKTLDQANFGFCITKDFWIDFGYIYNPVGYESSWAAKNQITFVTVGGYYEPGSVLGAKLTYKFSDKVTAGIMVGDPYSLAYAQNTNLAGMMFVSYKPLKNLSLIYNNFFGNTALVNSTIKNNILYNNFIVTYVPVKKVELAGQLDFSSQTNSQKPPDTTRIASMFSGFIQARYLFSEKFNLTAKYEFLNDPHGFMTGLNSRTNRGLRTSGFGISFEYRPVPFGYLRAAYRYLEGYPGSLDFASNTSDTMVALIFSVGVRL